jgi:hypothetical protein
MLEMPLPGQEAAPPTQWQAEEEGAAFLTFMQQVKGET